MAMNQGDIRIKGSKNSWRGKITVKMESKGFNANGRRQMAKRN
jgi:hypothetical protein